MKKIISSLILTLNLITCSLVAQSGPYFATGIKIGEVTSSRAIVWARLTSVETADTRAKQASAPGVSGTVQVRYWPAGEEAQATILPPVPVDPERDFICQIGLEELLPATSYQVEVTALSDAGVKGQVLTGKFNTAPDAGQVSEFTGVVVSCQGLETVDDPQKGHWSYAHMLTHNPDIFIHTGDVVYYDKDKAQPYSKNVADARQRWNRMFGLIWNRDFHAQVASYFMKDDHDTLKNDCWPGQTYGDLTWQEGLALFKEQTPQGELPYRSLRWGKDVELWFLEGRDYRSANTEPDGPDKTILGPEQKAWLKRTVVASDATFKLVVFPSPVVGPDKDGKTDNHSNAAFEHEGKELREFFAGIANTYVVCGDRHWQYASQDPATGLIEICSGPINNAHGLRGGFIEKDPKYHLYYGGGKGGYLRVDVKREDEVPTLTFTWFGDKSSNGAINHQMVFQAAAK